ncbi:Rpn family recombination-promoting nuclease/putative transposase [Wolbachia endosymbiont of Folsomia candida]|uniref:Rpn family recombination-promoting nuclease/putative transposase n=1 Tax=Wolbachia endosymbiont of Folsomia candida TaxID=169402 RepID=UPI000B17B4EE|nr:Rpn family recombination-promoting nuclease/putative transposase [Wolbachia endosymbiont of Folsomia candida]APR97975.1 transposase [Wolbachia endosymbiont of Folsomia candida]
MAISKFLDPKNDLCFKRIFGTERNKNILIHFLNDILGFSESDAIEEVEFLSTIQDAEIASDKQSIVDVLCKDLSGVRYVVEMQLARDKGFEKRAQYYAARAYSRQIDKSGRYIDLKTVYFIAISNCNLFPDQLDYISTHNVRDIRTNGCYLKDLQFVFIELPKFPKDKEDELENIIEKWCYFFKYAEESTDEDVQKVTQKAPIIKQAYSELDKFNWSEKELINYEEEILRISKEEAILEYKLDLATQKGAMKAKIEVAKNLFKAGVSIDVISQTTGLSFDEIKQL